MEQPMKYEASMNAENYSVVKRISDEIMRAYGEIMGAKNYAHDAIENKMSDKVFAENRLSMSSDELGHGEGIIAGINRMMDKLKAQHPAAYTVAQVFWEQMHRDLTNQIAKVRALHEQYRKIS